MGRGVASPAPVVLPKVSFVKVQDKNLTEPAGVHDIQARSFGYNDFSEFQRPEHYIRYIEPLEHELAVQVEYDMDEQDHEWLDAVNADRKKEQIDKVTYETFEIVMDRLEKEWFDLTKTLPKPDMAMPSEDSTCAICDDSEGENTNAIVFCDGCNLAVHQDCYGVPYIPEGQWLCRKCTVSPETPVSCILCPNEGGAFKQTVHGEWVHLLCAIWVPETRVVNEVFMEPITGIDRISKQRWKLKCSICDVREGACIQCSKSSCFLAFHPTCARKERLLMPMKAAHGSDAPSLTCFCEKHLPKEQQDARDEALAAERESSPQNESAKTARAYATTYSSGPPLVPALIVDRIMHYINKVIIRKKLDFVLMVCKYWSLKREGRRGAPLLKRLHLEPWTATNSGAGAGRGSEEEKTIKLEHMKKLRRDLESVRMIAELARKRESKKLEQAQIIQDVSSKCLYPHEGPLRFAFERIITSDRHEYFKNPVSKADVPDYFDVVKRPMCWSTIDSKLDRHEYWDTKTFREDVILVLDNAILYNKYDTPFYKTAHRIKTSAKIILAELDSLIVPSHLQQPLIAEAQPRIKEQDGTEAPCTSATLGNLEPRLDILETLVSPNAIQDDTELEYLLDSVDPIVSLFNYELGRLKPPPPPPPPKKARGRGKQKAKKEKRMGRDQSALDSSPGFRASRTRQEVAVPVETEEGAGPSVAPEEPDSTNAAASMTTKKIKWKRGPTTLPGQSSVPPMVETVNNQQSFKMFDAGWILPPDQKRGGRARVERPPPLPPKKRVKMDKSRSSAGPEENEASKENSGQLEVMEIENALDRASPPPVTEATKPKGKGKVKVPVIIIEELDTPATRREKSIRKKAEKAARLAAEAEAAAQEAGEAEDRDTDLSSLSRADSAEEDQPESDDEADANPSQIGGKRGRPKRLLSTSSTGANKKGKRAVVPEAEPGTIILGPGEKLESGTLVWAKADTFPWWAAVVFEPDVEGIPKQVSAIQHLDDQYLVRFYDKNNSWQWLDLSRLKLLGEDKALDEDMLAGSSKRQKWRNHGIRYACRNSYRRAVAEMETAGEALGGEEVVAPSGPDDTGGSSPAEGKETVEGGEPVQGNPSIPSSGVVGLNDVPMQDAVHQDTEAENSEPNKPGNADVIMEELDTLSDVSELSDLPDT